MFLLTLPNELLLQISSGLDLPSTYSLLVTCRRFSSLFYPQLHTFAASDREHYITCLYFAACYGNRAVLHHLLTHPMQIIIKTPTTTLFNGTATPPLTPSTLTTTILTHAPNLHISPCPTTIPGNYGPELHDTSGATPLHFAAKKGKTTLLHHLLRLGHDLNARDDHDRCALYWASRSSQQSAVELLLSQPGINLGDSFHTLIRNEEHDNDFPETPLHAAAFNGHFGIAKMLLDCGANVNALDGSNYTPLICAARKEHNTSDHSVARLLIAAGAKLDVKEAYNGDTALHEAVYRGNYGLAQLLVEEGADPAIKTLDPQYSRLIPSAIAGREHNRPLKLMLETHPNTVEWVDEDGRTPLHRAAMEGDGELVEILLEMGVDPERRDFEGLVAWEGCVELGGFIRARTRGSGVRRGELVDLVCRCGALARVCKPWKRKEMWVPEFLD